MSVYTMNVAQTMHFVELYHDADCLWNTNSEMYKDRKARDEALQEISNEMDINGFGKREVAQKIKNVRSAYYQELKKINNSKKSGASAHVYQPRVPWFRIVHSFLKLNPETDATISNLHDSPVQNNKISTKPKVQDSFDLDNSIEENFTNEKVRRKPVKVSSMSCHTTSLRKRRLQYPFAPPSRIGKAIEKLDTIRKTSTLETEFDIWCKSLAKQLNNMETLRALKLQFQIQSLISKERIAYETQKNHFSSGIQQPHISASNLQPGSYPKPQTSNCKNGRSTPAQPNPPEEDSIDSYLSSTHSLSSDFDN